MEVNNTKILNCAEVYSFLEDDVSKNIFMSRVFSTFTGDKRYIRDVIHKQVGKKCALSLSNDLDKMKKSKKIIIYGAGYWGNKTYDLLKILKINIFAFCDKNSKATLHNIKKISLKEAVDQEDTLIIVSTDKHIEEMSSDLMECGASKEQVIIMEKSWFIFNDPRQYFDKSIINLKDNEVFIDCGAADGYDTIRFFENCGDCCKAYLLEPNIDNLKELEYRFKYDPRVQIIPKGVWNVESRLKIVASDRWSGKLVEDKNGDIEVASLDALFKGKDKVSYIKMDVEGSELKALQGAEKIIRRDRPKLAICVYHKPEDIYEIPLYIKKLVPEYKLFLRHYSNYECETVLYAIK